LERVPSDPSLGQVAGVEVVMVVPETVVVVNWQGCQLTARLVVVPPVTVAVRVVAWPTIMLVPMEEVTETVTALAELLLPQPAARHPAANAASTQVQIVRNFIQPPPG
jgi:hypothetical protein